MMVSIGSVEFDSGIIIQSAVISKAANSALAAIKNELPEEARTYEICDYIIKASADALKEKIVRL